MGISAGDVERLKAEWERAQKRWDKKKTERSRMELNRAQFAYDKARMARRHKADDGFDFYITDHAALRFIQRRMGLDLREIKAMMLEEIDADIVQTIGEGKYPMKEGGKLVVEKNGAAVTFLS